MKPRRDITLGEMQDECKNWGTCSRCPYYEVCPTAQNLNPSMLDLAELLGKDGANEKT